MRKVCAAVVLWCAALAGPSSAAAREVAGVVLPDVSRVAGRELRLNGMGQLKRKLFCTVYVMGLYLEQPTRDARQALAEDAARRIVLVMRHDVERDRLVEEVGKSLAKSAGPAAFLRERLDRLIDAIPDLRRGDVLELTYQPGAGTLVRAPGRHLSIPGKDFADALLSAWLGPDPVDGKLKRHLLGR
jgi:hypothetical protein